MDDLKNFGPDIPAALHQRNTTSDFSFSSQQQKAEDKGPDVENVPFPKMEVVEGPFIKVLREHIDFLKERWISKDEWYQELLTKKEKEVEELKRELVIHHEETVKLRVALSQAVQLYVSEIGEPTDDVNWWRLLARGE